MQVEQVNEQNTAPAVVKFGRRYYADRFPFSLKGHLKALGCSWDPDRRAWWTGKAATAGAMAELLTTAAPAAPVEICTWTKLGEDWLVTGPREQLASGKPTVQRRAKPTHEVQVGGLFEQFGRWYARPVEDTTARGGGRRTGCACGSREDSFGDLVPSPRNCRSCRHDA